MRIAFVSDILYPQSKGGSEKRLWSIAKRLAEHNDVHIYTMGWERQLIKFPPSKLQLHFVAKGDSLYNQRGQRSIINASRFMFASLRKLSHERFDIVDCSQSPLLHCLSGKIVSYGRNPLVMTVHEVWGDYWYEYMNEAAGFFGKFVEHLALSLPNAIITVSKLTKREILSVNSKSNVFIVPNGIDLSAINHSTALENRFDIIYVGRLIATKKVDYLLEAIYQAKKYIPTINCAIVGDGPQRYDLERLTVQLNLSKNVKFLGKIEDETTIILLFKSSKIFLSCSVREGFGMAFLEANAAGLPVIGVKASTNAATEIITNGLNGFIVNLEPKEIASAIIFLLKNESLRREMGHAGELFTRKFDWDEIAKLTINVYDNLLC